MKKVSSVVGIDLGNHSLKAVRLQKTGDQCVLTRVAILPSAKDPVNPGNLTEEVLAKQIKELITLVKPSGADIHFTVNSPSSTVRYVELPNIPLDEIRSALKLNSTTYLRQNFENYTFDACPLDAEAQRLMFSKKAKDKKTNASHAPAGRIKTLVGGIQSPEVILYYHAARSAGIKPRSLQLAPISLINGFEAAYPAIFQAQAVALLDIGFLSSSLTILDKGKPLLTRLVPIGGKQITEYIAQMNNMDFAKAETAKLSGEVDIEEAVSRTCSTLVREVCSSINFFEKNSDQPISKVYLTGSSVRSEKLVAALGKDIATGCEAWNVTGGLTIQLPHEQQDIFTENQAVFSTALGVARTYIQQSTPQQETQEQPALAS